MGTTLNIKTIDRQSKPSSMSIGISDSATNAQLQAVADAVDGVIIGAAVSATKTISTTIDLGSGTPPSDRAANRHNKLLIRIQDSNNGKIFTHEIGTFNDALLPSSTDDYLDISTNPSPGKSLKDAIEAVYLSPYGYSGVVLSVQQINRNG